MKRNIIAVAAAVMTLMTVSCQKTIINASDDGYGYLSFGEFSLDVDEVIDTKAIYEAGDNYIVTVQDADGNEVFSSTYAEVLSGEGKIALKAGTYDLVARSVRTVPVAAFAQPVYGAVKTFTIKSGEETKIGDVVCTLLQCKVTVSYSDDFLSCVTGDCNVAVTLTSGYPLDYPLVYGEGADGPVYDYEQEAGYFAVNEGTTLEVKFEGQIEGQTQKMTKLITGITPKQWRQIKFVQKKNTQGTASFEISIDDLLSSEPLNSQDSATEEVIGEDPDAPLGDGGIQMLPDYEGGCDADITDLNNIRIVPVSTKDMKIILKAIIPNGIKSFNVDITSDTESFLSAVDIVDGRHIDLLNPSELQMGIFDIVPFPHGSELKGKKEVLFDLSDAQTPIAAFPGNHTFVMTVKDMSGFKKEILVTMSVEE